MAGRERFIENAQGIIQSLRADKPTVDHTVCAGITPPLPNQDRIIRGKDFINSIASSLPQVALLGDLEEPLSEEGYPTPKKYTLAERLHAVAEISSTLGIEFPMSVERQLDLCMLAATTGALSFVQTARQEYQQEGKHDPHLDNVVNHIQNAQLAFRTMTEDIDADVVYPVLENRIIKDESFIEAITQEIRASVEPNNQGISVFTNILDQISRGHTGNYEGDWLTIGNWFAIAENLDIQIPTKTRVILLGMCFVQKATHELEEQQAFAGIFGLRESNTVATPAETIGKAYILLGRFKDLMKARLPLLMEAEEIPEQMPFFQAES